MKARCSLRPTKLRATSPRRLVHRKSRARGARRNEGLWGAASLRRHTGRTSVMCRRRSAAGRVRCEPGLRAYLGRGPCGVRRGLRNSTRRESWLFTPPLTRQASVTWTSASRTLGRRKLIASFSRGTIRRAPSASTAPRLGAAPQRAAAEPSHRRARPTPFVKRRGGSTPHEPVIINIAERSATEVAPSEAVSRRLATYQSAGAQAYIPPQG